MKQCVLFCAAEFDRLLLPVQESDYVIAADGGLRHTQALGLIPAEILGDFDSLGYTPGGAQVFPVEKDDTDTMLAVKHALRAGCDRVLIYGGLDGPRLDHTVANFQTLQYLCDRGACGYLIGSRSIVTVIRQEEIRFAPGCSGDFSAFCMGADAGGITLKGLYYPLTDGTLTCGFPLGVSNHFTGEEAGICVGSGSLLLIWDRSAGLPVERKAYHANL